MQGKAGTILVITQVYPPDPAAVGQQIADVAAKMAEKGWRVIVYTASRGYDDPTTRYVSHETRDGVHIRRLPLSSFGKGSIAIRLLAQALFMVQAVVLGLFTRSPFHILVSTSPPFAGFGGAIISWLRRAPLVWWVMDINPDQLVASGRVSRGSIIVRLFEWMNRYTLRQAKHVIVLDRFMRERMLGKAAIAEQLHVVPPWPHDRFLADIPHADNVFRDAHGLQGAFVVMYAGNHGYATPVESLLEAARLLEDDPRIKFVFIGGGVRKPFVDEYVAREHPPNVIALPYLPLSEIRYSLSAADVHIVSIAADGVGIVHPCKLYGALAIGRPVIAIAPAESYAGDILRQQKVGWLCEKVDARSIAALIRHIASHQTQALQQIANDAKDLASAEYRADALSDRICDLLA